MNVKITPQTVNINVNAAGAGITLGTPVARDFVDRDPYTGSYEITPSAETQILETRNLRMTDNITVNPIPSNYGLVEWDGSVMRIS